ncbi:MAG TPA: type III-B CRISPR module-associated protein Cmr5 [Verrucomicrobiota bacterium]|nr:type III-B CRISPR module-associated protein Cmr5 [Verrucomicrobiota bacterium]
MKNLEQIRAANAIAYAEAGVNTRGTKGGEVVKKLPALIMSNGLLAAGAFAYAKGEDEGWYVCFDHLARHLAHPDVGILPHDKHDLKSLMDHLTSEADSAALKQATDEALAWLCYAKRFVKKEKDQGGEDDSN